MATATLERESDFVIAKPLSIALIGPDEPRRGAVSGVLAEYPAIRVAEFSSYPTHLETVARLLAQEFNILIVDLDSDPKVALNLIETIRRDTTITVIPYTEEADPEVMTRCMRAGAREHLVLPARHSTLDRIFARARICLPSDFQPAAKPEPQVIEPPKPEPQILELPKQVIELPETDAWQDDPPPSEPVRMEDEDPLQVPESLSEPVTERVSEPVSEPALERAVEQVSGQISEPRGNSVAPDLPPAVAPHERGADRTFNVVSSSTYRLGSVVVEEIRFTPEAKTLAARAEEQDSSQKFRTVDTGSNTPSPAVSPWEKFLSGAASGAPGGAIRAVEPVARQAVKPAVKWRDSIEPVHEESAIETDDENGKETDFLAFHSDLADLGEEDSDRKKWVRIGAASFAALVLLLFVGPRLFAPARHAVAAQTASPAPAASDPEPAAKTPKPSPSNALHPSHLSVPADARPSAIAQPAANVDEAIWPKGNSTAASAAPATALAPRDAESVPPEVDSTMMNAQLASTPRIPKDVKVPHKAEAPPPPGLDTANADEIADGAAVAGSVFSKPVRGPAVLPPTPVVIPVQVAEKLLIYKTLPTYPPAAYKHYVSGKVVLQAIVSAAGSVESAKVVSGPKALEQAALDAVKTWRYKPYVVDGKLARVQTTVTLTFDPHR